MTFLNCNLDCPYARLKSMPCFNWDLSKKRMHASATLLHYSSLVANLAIFFRIIILLCPFCCTNIFSWEKVILFMSLYREVNVLSTMHFIKLITINWSVYCPNDFLLDIASYVHNLNRRESLWGRFCLTLHIVKEKGSQTSTVLDWSLSFWSV